MPTRRYSVAGEQPSRSQTSVAFSSLPNALGLAVEGGWDISCAHMVETERHLRAWVGHDRSVVSNKVRQTFFAMTLATCRGDISVSSAMIFAIWLSLRCPLRLRSSAARALASACQSGGSFLAFPLRA